MIISLVVPAFSRDTVISKDLPFYIIPYQAEYYDPGSQTDLQLFSTAPGMLCSLLLKTLPEVPSPYTA